MRVARVGESATRRPSLGPFGDAMRSDASPHRLCRALAFPFKCVAEVCIEIYLACAKAAGVSKASRDAARAVVRTGGVGDGDRAEDPPADPRLMV